MLTLTCNSLFFFFYLESSTAFSFLERLTLVWLVFQLQVLKKLCQLHNSVTSWQLYPNVAV